MSAARKAGVVVSAVVLVGLALAVLYTIYGGASSGATSSGNSSSTNSALSSTNAMPPYITRTDPLSAASQDVVCTGLNASETADNNEVITSGQRNAYYVTQYWFYPNNAQSYLSYNVAATQKNDSYGYGPSLNVNGATNKGYWYQVGLAYNYWNHAGNGHSTGFSMFYQVWNTQTNQVVYPSSSGSTSLVNFASLKAGDNVTLSLNFQNDKVVMSAIDLRTGESMMESYPAFGAVYFSAGDPKSNYPTSLLTEWPHVVPFLCLNTLTQFVPTSGGLNGGWLETNIWNFTGYPVAEWWKGYPLYPGQYKIHTPSIPFSLPSTGKLFYLNYAGLGSYVENDGFFTM